MKWDVEYLDRIIWLFVFLPAVIVAFFVWGWVTSLLIILAAPVAIIIKNAFLEKHFSWKPKHSVGVKAFDEDHQKLFAMIFRMYKSVNSVRGNAEAKAVIKELRDYTETHFNREEMAMEKHGYESLEPHRKEHDEMKVKVQEFQESFNENSLQVSKDVLRYLHFWLTNHIMNTDKMYTEFLNSKGVN